MWATVCFSRCQEETAQIPYPSPVPRSFYASACSRLNRRRSHHAVLVQTSWRSEEKCASAEGFEGAGPDAVSPASPLAAPSHSPFCTDCIDHATGMSYGARLALSGLSRDAFEGNDDRSTANRLLESMLASEHSVVQLGGRFVRAGDDSGWGKREPYGLGRGRPWRWRL